MKHFFFLLLITTTISSEISGQIYKDILDDPTRDWESSSRTKPEGNSFSPRKRAVALSDSTFLISGRILMNLDADAYKLTLSLHETAQSVDACQEVMDTKIALFNAKIVRLGIETDAIYIDAIAQYPVYDYDIERKVATQEKVGYEINKNIIIRFDSLSKLKEILSLAAECEIYDAVKLDYIIHDLDSVYETLFLEASEVIQKKKSLYLQLTNLAIEDQAMVFSEQFQFVFPNQLYEGYQAFESSEVDVRGYRARAIIEQEKKKTLRYYEGVSFSGFDRIIHPDKVSIGLQAIFEIQLIFEKKKDE